MKQINEIEVELEEFFPALLPINRKNCYLVPVQYFDNLPEVILTRLRERDDIQIPVSRQAYEVPENYFENLAGNVLKKIKLQKAVSVSEVESELVEVAPFLNQISRKNVYEVPEGYFEQLKTETPAQQKPGKIVSGFGWKKNWNHYLVAASIMFVVALGTYLYTGLQPAVVQRNFNIEQSLQTVNDQEIISYLQENRDITPDIKATDPNFDFQSLIKNVSDEEIRNYLNDDGEGGEKNIKGI